MLPIKFADVVLSKLLCYLFYQRLDWFSKIWEIQETLHNHKPEDASSQIPYDDLESAKQGSETKENVKAKTSILMNWPLMSSIIVYCVFQLHDMAYTEVNI